MYASAMGDNSETMPRDGEIRFLLQRRNFVQFTGIVVYARDRDL